MLTCDELHAALIERHGADIQDKLDRARVGVAGLGGLGSNIAVHLARLGVGTLVLADCDVIEVSNLNRQHYTMKDIGIPKTLALLEQLEAINPYLNYETYTERIIPANAVRLFADCDIVCEAFDRADQKAMLTEALLAGLPEIRVVSGSGMAGWDSPNRMTVRRPFPRLYLCGDSTSSLEDGLDLMAPRVALCAAQQATVVLRLLLGENEP
ncbi:sulfur carrier protein ThiS adenylyltransferase ThiF [Agathobaculum sp.]|uniref:sulfur carrier protein ThiS adenylyltransferase ThiF n=1 Tax=Agathobaculum sp. TaxID=2048138 RepID=UPI002A80FDF1|nr:sulfur carrier protein ThiS adenylyltransferase ThiF [Agathobaculum sp.]MDY3619156.1 sulfur carrier protein ThiS adenylyltransferase ThiF [Agathobaculum sp.]